MILVNKIISIGIALLFIGIILIFVGSLLSTVKSEKSNVKSAGIVFVGPFPLAGWASDKGMFYTLIAITILMLIIYFFLFKRF